MVFVRHTHSLFSSDTIVETVLYSCEVNGIATFSDRKLSDLEYAGNIALLSEDPSKLQVCSK